MCGLLVVYGMREPSRNHIGEESGGVGDGEDGGGGEGVVRFFHVSNMSADNVCMSGLCASFVLLLLCFCMCGRVNNTKTLHRVH